ncbi:MAG: META domain-containing protein [Candidatus Kapaibacterium sp.]
MSDITGITWKLRSFSTVSGEERPVPATATVTLLLTDSARLGGKGGCNSYGGPYQIHDSLLSVTGPMFRTKMSCGEIATEDEYLDALAKSVRYRSDGKSLLIYYGDGNHILSFTRM